jgi:hypothetical protein
MYKEALSKMSASQMTQYVLLATPSPLYRRVAHTISTRHREELKKEVALRKDFLKVLREKLDPSTLFNTGNTTAAQLQTIKTKVAEVLPDAATNQAQLTTILRLLYVPHMCGR